MACYSQPSEMSEYGVAARSTSSNYYVILILICPLIGYELIVRMAQYQHQLVGAGYPASWHLVCLVATRCPDNKAVSSLQSVGIARPAIQLLEILQAS